MCKHTEKRQEEVLNKKENRSYENDEIICIFAPITETCVHPSTQV